MGIKILHQRHGMPVRLVSCIVYVVFVAVFIIGVFFDKDSEWGSKV